MNKILLSDILKNQATITIGCIGHVSHGKSTIINKLTGMCTMRHSFELKKNSTVNLGYANIKIYKTIEEEYYFSNKKINSEDILVKHISFVDCPGHESYISNMLNGTSVMDYVLLLVDSTDKIVLQNQTIEQLSCLLVNDIDRIICIQNKIDLLNNEECKLNKEKIKEQLKNNFNLNIPIIPISAQFGYNLKFLKKIISSYDEIIERKINKDLLFPIIRSFDINKPGINPIDIQGGVIGGSLINGYLKNDEIIEIRPGIYDDKNNICYPILSKVINIKSNEENISVAFPGGLIGIQLNVDPVFTKNNNLVGHVLGNYSKMPTIYKFLKLKIKNLKRVKSKISKDDIIKIHTLSYYNFCKVLDYDKKNKEIFIELKSPICTNKNLFISIFINNNNKYSFNYIGKILDGIEVKIEYKDNLKNIYANNRDKIEIINDINNNNNISIDINYNDLLLNINKNNNIISKVKIKSSKIDILNKVTYLINFKEIMLNLKDISNNDINNIKKIFFKYLKIEDFMFFMYDEEKDIIMFNKKYKENEMNNIIKNFINLYIKCKICKQFNTEIIKKEREYWVKCEKCGYEKYINFN